MSTLYPFFSLLRKLLLIYVIVFLQNKPVLSIFVWIYLSLIMIILAGYLTSFKSKIENYLNLLNEVFVIFVCYGLFTFTDFISDASTREYVGYCLVALILICISINFGVVGYSTATLSSYKLKLQYRKCKYFAAVKSMLKRRKQK